MSSNTTVVVNENGCPSIESQREFLIEAEFDIVLARSRQANAAFKTVLQYGRGLTAFHCSETVWRVLVAVRRSYHIDEIVRALEGLRDEQGRKVLQAVRQRDPRNRPFGFMLPHFSNASPNGERRPLYPVAEVQTLVEKLNIKTGSRVHSTEAQGYWMDDGGKTFVECGTWIAIEAAQHKLEQVRSFVEELFDDPNCDQFSFYLSGYGQAEQLRRPQS